MQLTIPAVNVIHRTVGTPGDSATAVSGTTRAAGVAELSGVVPCIPIGQIRVPGLPNLSAPGLQPLPSLSMETVNILGLANTNVAPQVHPPGLALNAVGLQVLTANPPSQSSPTPQAHIPGLQIVNIALPTLIPSVGQVAVDAPGAPEMPPAHSRAREAPPQPASAASAHPGSSSTSPQGSPQVQRANAKKVPDPSAPARAPARPDGSSKVDAGKAASVNHVKPKPELAPVQGQPAAAAEPPLPARPEAFPEPPGPQTPSPDRAAPRPAARRCSARGGEAERRERTRRPGRPHPRAAGASTRAPALLSSLRPGAPPAFSAPETEHLSSASAPAEHPSSGAHTAPAAREVPVAGDHHGGDQQRM